MGYLTSTKIVAKNCSEGFERRVPDDGPDCHCKEQVEEKTKEMEKCGKFKCISIEIFWFKYISSHRNN